MTSNNLNFLKPYTALCCLHTKTKFSLLLLLARTLPFSKLILRPFSTTIPRITNKSVDPNGISNAKAQKCVSLLKKCSTLREVEQIHAHIVQTGLDQNLFVIGKILVFCAVSELGSMDYAASLFDKIASPDGFLWNSMIRGFGRTRQVGKVFDYFKGMKEDGHPTDNFTLAFLIKVSGQFGFVILGKQIHCNALKLGFGYHVFVRNSLIHMYGMFKDIGTACQLFEGFPKPDLVAWNIIIDCHVCCGRYENALELFLRMRQTGIEPDETTLVVTLSACSALGNLDFGQRMHSWINDIGFDNSVWVSNSLIDMYAKCGEVEQAYKIFYQMKRRSLVTWNAMILGLAMHGHANKALELFSQMLNENMAMPNDVTFLGVLSACSHGGLVEEGRRYFNMMISYYHIQPTVKLYGCMVDLLSRAGLVEEAYRLIQSMPMECNAIVWRTLLAACRVHGNIELGEEVRRHLLELEPDHSSDYVLLANAYASAGQWNNAMKVRRSMSHRGVQKPEPGNSSC